MRVSAKGIGVGIALAIGITGFAGGAAMAANGDADQIWQRDRDQVHITTPADQTQLRDRIHDGTGTGDQTQLRDRDQDHAAVQLQSRDRLQADSETCTPGTGEQAQSGERSEVQAREQQRNGKN